MFDSPDMDTAFFPTMEIVNQIGKLNDKKGTDKSTDK